MRVRVRVRVRVRARVRVRVRVRIRLRSSSMVRHHTLSLHASSQSLAKEPLGSWSSASCAAGASMCTTCRSTCGSPL